MSIIMTTNFQKDLLPGVQQFFGNAYPQWASKYDQYFDVSSSTERYAEDVITSGLGLMNVKEEGEPVTYDTMKQGWTKRYAHVIYTTGFIISREARDDGHALDLAKEGATSCKRSVVQTRETVCANVLNRAFNNSYKGGDGVELCSGSHVTATGTGSNKAAVDSDISELALEQAVIDIHNINDERGLKAFLEPQKLVIPVTIEFDLKRILGNPMRPATADRDINALYAMGSYPGGYVVVPWLTDTDAWFVKTDAEKGLRYIERNAPEMTEDGDFDTENAKYKCRMRFSTGWSDWRGVYGTPGA